MKPSACLLVVSIILVPFADTFRSSRTEPRGKKMTRINFDLKVYCLENLPIPENIGMDTTYTQEDEKKVLEELYHCTGGNDWKNKTGWLDPNTHHCNWFGVTCHKNTHYVISLDLGNNNLVNRLPSNLWKLRNLLALCAGSNSKLRGELKDVIFGNMTSLIRIELAFSALYGSIPECISNLTSLVKIQLCCQKGTGLTGSIPSGIGNLTELQVLSLGENGIGGEIPIGIGRLTKLWFLDFEILRNLRGSIDLFYNLTSMNFLHLSNCGLRGSISPDFGKFFPYMNQCLLPGTNIKGNIPRSVNYMKNLTQLVLSQNHLHGLIPKTIGEIPSLSMVDMSANQLDGLENGTTFGKSNIEILILSGNRDLSADFTTFVNSLTSLEKSLRILNISSCHFYGEIPAKLWNFPNLISVDIGDNKLHGEVPEVPVNMVFLLKVDLSKNNLSGHIPASFSMLHVLQELDISKNPDMKSPISDKRALQNFLEPDLSILIKENSSAKFSCPRLRFSFSRGIVIVDPCYYDYSYCICDVGYYGYQNKCKKCMSGGRCEDRDGAHIRYPSVMTVTQGYYPFPKPHNVTHLVQCNNTPYQFASPCNPNGSLTCNLESINGSWFTRCGSSSICEEGSYDRFCSRCKKNYYRSGNLCFKCPKFSVNITLLIVLFAISLVVLWWAFVYVRRKTRSLALLVVCGQVVGLGTLWCVELIPGWLFEINTVLLLLYVAGKGRKTRGIAKIFIFYLQIFDAMISGINLWPSQIFMLHHYISSIVNFHFASMACQYPFFFKPVGRLLVVLTVPIIGIAIVWTYFCAFYLWDTIARNRNWVENRPLLEGGVTKIQKLKWECRQTSIVILNMIYFPVVKQTVAMIIPCKVDSGVSYLPNVPWLDCTASNTTFVYLRVIAAAGILLYVIGIPFVIFGPLLKKYSKICKELVKHDDPPLELIEKQAVMDVWLGSIYLPYREAVRSKYEIFALLRKFLIAFSISFIPRYFSLTMMVLIGILFGCFVVHMLLKPYIDSYDGFPVENFCEGLVLGVLLYSFILLPFAVMNDRIDNDIILWLIIAINAVTIVILIVCAIAIFRKKIRVEGIAADMMSQTVSQYIPNS